MSHAGTAGLPEPIISRAHQQGKGVNCPPPLVGWIRSEAPQDRPPLPAGPPHPQTAVPDGGGPVGAAPVRDSGLR